MNTRFQKHVSGILAEIEGAGLTKNERVIVTPQGAAVRTSDGREVLNFCANNYLGFANHPAIREAARASIDERGYGLASVRFICGTLDIHKELESRLAAFLHMEDAILYGSCFDANGGLFEPLFTADDAIISDALNHASIIDGIRLCKARRYRYRNNDMADLEEKLRAADAEGARFKIIATDGVFSMDGVIADLASIRRLADKYDALVMVDDSHAAGFVGAKGHGTPELCGVEGKIDIVTGTLGKALGGASGGYTAAGKEIVSLLRQRSRPYLFSNTVPPSVVGASLRALDLISAADDLRRRLAENMEYFRSAMTAAGFTLRGAGHPIVPVMFGDAAAAAKTAALMLDKGIYVTAFSYPVVPKGEARIRVQLSAAHSREDLDRAVAAFREAREELAGQL